MADRFIGQHHDDHEATVNNGQRSRHLPDVDAGQLSGGEEHGGSRVHRSGPGADRNGTTTIPPNDIHRAPKY